MNPRAGSGGAGYPGGNPPGSGASRRTPDMNAPNAPNGPNVPNVPNAPTVPDRSNPMDAPHSGSPARSADGTGTPDAGDTGVGAEVEYELSDLIGVLQRERDEYLDTLRRVQADFENYKKRILRQQTDHLERAGEDLVTKMLPVLDAFDLARAHLGNAGELNEEGKALLAASALLNDTLAREGLQRIDDPGAPFDPTTHEAVEHVPDRDPAPRGASSGSGSPGSGFSGGGLSGGASPGGASSGVGGTGDTGRGNGEKDEAGPVVDGVLRAGYRWKGRVIRPALVRVRG
jgi:molecular chaperone GrpE